MQIDANDEKESAFEWLHRVRAAKRRLAQNPIFFPSLSSFSPPAATAASLPASTNDNAESNSHRNGPPLQDSSRFIVQEINVIHLASLTFQCRTAKRNELMVRSQRWWRKRRLVRHNDDHDIRNKSKQQDLAQLEELFLQSFPSGTGIEFVDKALTNHRRINDDIVFEIIGRTRTAKTKILQVLAANYAAATSTLSMAEMIVGMNHQVDATKLVNVPIVILDPEHAIDFQELLGLVRVAILRKWNKTNDLRQCYQRISLVENNGYHFYLQEPCAENDGGGNEYEKIEKDIQFALGRIHIVRPKDMSHGYVSALESIQQSLDEMKQTCFGGKSMPPVLLLFDSMLSAFQMSNKFLESLPNGNGLSGLNDFLRQLKKLRNGHETMIFATRTCTGDVSNQWRRSHCDGWNKLVTHRISIQKSVTGSLEERSGYDLVAIGHGPNGDVCGPPIPFSVTSRGIVCENRL